MENTATTSGLLYLVQQKCLYYQLGILGYNIHQQSFIEIQKQVSLKKDVVIQDLYKSCAENLALISGTLTYHR